MRRKSELEAVLRRSGGCVRLNPTESSTVRRAWLRAFASRVLQEKGCEVFGKFMWHGFSSGIEASTEGAAALVEYRAQFQAPFVVFDEDDELCFRCEPAPYPDLTALRDDLYVAHYNMKWTMVFTHEQPHIGPFFSPPERRRSSHVNPTRKRTT